MSFISIGTQKNVRTLLALVRSLINLNLKNDIIKQEIEWKYFSKSYNERSNIPQKLLLDIFKTVIKHFEEKTNDECTSI